MITAIAALLSIVALAICGLTGSSMAAAATFFFFIFIFPMW
jgi:hypothetical protein